MRAEAICLASGPSLTAADVETVRQWRYANEDGIVVVTNTTFRLAPWADVLFGMDAPWWRAHLDEVRGVFSGRLVTSSGLWRSLGIESGREIWPEKWVNYANSGANAIGVALCMDVERIALLGYDCRAVSGQLHWHGNHPKGLGNAGSLLKWPYQFEQVAKRSGRARIVNCTPGSALKVWPQQPLAQWLDEQRATA